MDIYVEIDGKIIGKFDILKMLLGDFLDEMNVSHRYFSFQNKDKPFILSMVKHESNKDQLQLKL